MGNTAGYTSLGEIRYFWEYLDRGDRLCGCGSALRGCPFWGPVIEELARDGRHDPALLAGLSQGLNRTRNLPIMTGERTARSPAWRTLLAGTAALYEAVGRRASGSMLVDASKVPSQLFLLKRVPDVDVRVLHLVRDSRAVAYSWQRRQKREPAVRGGGARMPRHSWLRSALAWNTENRYTQRFASGLPYAVLRHEDFARRPRPELDRALSALGLEADLSLLDRERLRLAPTHSVGGNPLRFSRETVCIQADEEWRSRMPVPVRIALGALTWPGLLRFGYGL